MLKEATEHMYSLAHVSTEVDINVRKEYLELAHSSCQEACHSVSASSPQEFSFADLLITIKEEIEVCGMCSFVCVCVGFLCVVVIAIVSLLFKIVHVCKSFISI